MALEELNRTDVKVYLADISTQDIQLMTTEGNPWRATACTNPSVIGAVSVRGISLLLTGATLPHDLLIKPMLFMEDGAVTPMEKVKTKEKAIDKLLEFVSEFDAIEQTAIFQRSLQTTTETALLLERLRQLFPGKSFPILQYNPLLASYVGPEAMGVIVYEGESFF
jgi:hypothetical protein